MSTMGKNRRQKDVCQNAGLETVVIVKTGSLCFKDRSYSLQNALTIFDYCSARVLIYPDPTKDTTSSELASASSSARAFCAASACGFNTSCP